jgi:uncharacterized membrane protein
MLGFIRTTILGGVTFLLPIAAIFIVLAKFIKMASDAAAPLADKLPIPKAASVMELYTAAIAVFLLVSFLAGYLLQKVPFERNLMPFLEDKVLRKFPPYTAAKRYTNLLAGIEINDGMKPALIQVGQTWQLGFIVESLGNDNVLAFVPSTPDPSSGNIYVIHKDLTSQLNVRNKMVIDCIERSGKGFGKLLQASHQASDSEVAL